MKITVDISEFYMEEENTLDEALTSRIRNEVVNTIWQKISSKVEDIITKNVQEEIKKELTGKISAEVSRIIEQGIFNLNGKETTLSEWIHREFAERSAYRSPAIKIDEICNKLSIDLKNRYDSIFAVGIVKRLTANGFIDKAVAAKIIGPGEQASS